MPEVIETTVYTFDELDDHAKERARDWYREGISHENWHEFVFDDFERICEILGVDLAIRPVRLYGDGTRRSAASGSPVLRARVMGRASRAATATGKALRARSEPMPRGISGWLQSPTSFSKPSAGTSMP